MKHIIATVHIVFNENGSQAKGGKEAELISRMMEKASGLDWEMQELLVKFVEFLKHEKGEKVDPS